MWGEINGPATVVLHLAEKVCETLRMNRHLSYELVEDDAIPMSLLGVHIC